MSALDGGLLVVRWVAAALCLVRAGWIVADARATYGEAYAADEVRALLWVVLAALLLEGSLG